jgi:SAF domain
LYAGNSAAAYGGHVPIEDVAARDIAAGDVVRLDDLQAQRVLRAVHVDGQVMLELRPVGLEIWETVRVSLPEDLVVSRLGTSAE